ncbi:MAG: PD-(D/E)XK nuclease family protein [Gaiellales bacterium]
MLLATAQPFARALEGATRPLALPHAHTLRRSARDRRGPRRPGRPHRPALAPTNLETYAACPHRYFLGNVLSLAPVEEPEAVQRIAANEKGSAVHAILERFLAELGDEGVSPVAHEAHLARLREIAGEELARAEAEGITGYPLLWEYDRRRILEISRRGCATSWRPVPASHAAPTR